MIRRKLINFAEMSCDYRVGPDALVELGSLVQSIVGTPKRALLLMGQSHQAEAGVLAQRALIDAGFQVFDVVLSEGEAPFNLSVAHALFEHLDEYNITADDVVVALGNMDICSLASYCAPHWCGGVALALVPTTLDAMVCSATQMRGLATSKHAEMLWLHAHPDLVVANLDFIQEATPESLQLGYLELISSALMDSKHAWNRLEAQLEQIMQGEEIALVDALCAAQGARLAAVKSPSPSAQSAPLFGVTTARALQSLVGSEFSYTQCLAEGMRFEARLAVEAGRFEADDMFAVDDRIWAVGIEEPSFTVEVDAFLSAIKRTRFQRSNRLLFALPQMIGSIRLSVVDEELLERHARAYLKSRAESLEPAQ
ncbi:hypothetical protein KPC83_04350 [Collinsella sp. zg1085]|uniref:hypothetical protein n=1 Tax=Collinsella sp. zg1085 TaxID=2844380 RepID=UPI001C0A966C|nr:hypothetical protein [Collinsella sp. zg1085]QWT17083.1 hypothetical protein KPC83_04350 [Collinsella sp. zg1085]